MFRLFIPDPGSRIWMLTFYPDPGVKKAPDPGSGSATLGLGHQRDWAIVALCGWIHA